MLLEELFGEGLGTSWEADGEVSREAFALLERRVLLCEQAYLASTPSCCFVISKKRKETSHLGEKLSFSTELLLKIAEFCFLFYCFIFKSTCHVCNSISPDAGQCPAGEVY